MKDRDFLEWIHQRLVNVHKEDEMTDYMHKLRAIILQTPKKRETPNDGRGANSMTELRKKLK